MSASTATATATPKKDRKPLVGHVLSGLVTLALVASSAGKLSGAKPIVENFEKFHIPANFLTPIGAIELLSAILFAVPKTSSLGTFLVTGYFGGAIVAHLAGNDAGGIVPAIVLGLMAWTANYLRNPSMFASLQSRSFANRP
jgi:DoxX-like family